METQRRDRIVCITNDVAGTIVVRRGDAERAPIGRVADALTEEAGGLVDEADHVAAPVLEIDQGSPAEGAVAVLGREVVAGDDRVDVRRPAHAVCNERHWVNHAEQCYFMLQRCSYSVLLQTWLRK